MDGASGLGVGDWAGCGGDLEDHCASEMSDLAALEDLAVHLEADGALVKRLRPAQFLNEELPESEVVQALPRSREVDCHWRSYSFGFLLGRD